jgi:hypothetical protein
MKVREEKERERERKRIREGMKRRETRRILRN